MIVTKQKLDARLLQCYEQLKELGYDVEVLSPEQIKVSVKKMPDITPKEKPIKK